MRVGLAMFAAERIESPSALSGGAVVVEAASVWATAFDDNVLFRIRGRA
jgi:hypothetical protein